MIFRRQFSVAATVATEAVKSAASTAAASAVKPQVNIQTPNNPKAAASVMSRVRAFASGAVFASAVGMYMIAFQLQGLLDEVKSAVHDVSVRQQLIESKIAKLSEPPSPKQQE